MISGTSSVYAAVSTEKLVPFPAERSNYRRRASPAGCPTACVKYVLSPIALDRSLERDRLGLDDEEIPNLSSPAWKLVC